jgi:thiol-disulfide isomerase/thioredoxin
MRAAAAVVLAAACGAPTDPGADRAEPREARAEDGRGPARGAMELDPPAGAGAMAPNLAPGADGEALLTWVEPDGAGQRVRISRLSGMRWSKPSTVTTGARVLASWADVPAAVRAADGGVYASWGLRGRGEASHLHVGRVPAGGEWKRLGRAHDDESETEHGFASFAADGPGAVAVWLDGRATGRGEPTSLRAARVGERGVAEPVLLDESVCDCCPTAAAVTGRGPVVVYRDRDKKEMRDISIVRRVDGRWTQPAAVHADGWKIDGCPVNGPVVAARGSTVAVAWYTEAGGRATVRAAFSSDAGARFAPPIEVDAPAGGRTPLGHVAVALDDAGDAIVTWVAGRSGGAADILVRRISAAGAAGPERVVAQTRAARSSGIPRALRVDEWLVVAWTDGGAKRVRASAVALREIGAPAPATQPPEEAAQAEVADAARAGKAAVGGRVPASYRARSIDGRVVRIQDLRGKVVVVNLWATWCGPCVAEFPHLVELHKTYARRGVEFVMLSTDEDAARARVLEAWRKHALPFTLWLDFEETAPLAFASPSIPVTLILDRRGIVRFRRDGKITASDAALVKALDAALAAR